MSERWTPAYDRLFDPDHELAGEPACMRWAWLDICHLTQKQDATRIIRMNPVEVRRGEFIASVRFLANRWGWSKSKVHRFMELLKSPDVAKIAEVRVTTDGTIYRVNGHEAYALRGTDNGTLVGQGKANGGNGMGGRHFRTWDTSRDEAGTAAGQILEEVEEVEGSGSKEPSPTAAAVGLFCQRVGAPWSLKESITAWADRVDTEPKYAGADIPYEIGKAAEWYVTKGRKLKAPTVAIHKWLERAGRDAQKNQKRNGSGDTYRIMHPIDWDGY